MKCGLFSWRWVQRLGMSKQAHIFTLGTLKGLSGED